MKTSSQNQIATPAKNRGGLAMTMTEAIRLYRVAMAPFFGNCCRFYPSCSHYAEEAIQKKGWLIGAMLAMRRILKCQPFHPGGFDPVE